MPKKTAETPIALLRRELKRRRLDGFIVPRADEHQGEYVPPSAQRLAWLTGFSGSAGTAVVLSGSAALFVDGRYTLQAANEVSADLFALHHLIAEPPHRWLEQTLTGGARIGYDPWLHTPDNVHFLQTACGNAGARLVAVAGNPLDAVWRDRPAPPMTPAVAHAIDYSGRAAADKRAEIAAGLVKAKCDAAFLSAPDSIAWLLNIRGNDVEFSPLPLSFALIHTDGTVDLFIEPSKLSDATRQHLGTAVRVWAPVELANQLAGLKGKRIGFDRAGSPAWVQDRLLAAGAVIVALPDPCLLPRARKNDVELSGTRNAHRRDGAALTRFLAWLATAALEGGVDEMSAATRLEMFRSQDKLYRGPSFPTIAGAGPNGAIVHYRASPASNRPLRPGEIFLLDSGGQYLDGTTDVTRTVAVGPAGAEEKRNFTLVLQGHIALASARFPPGTSGAQLDCLARRALWAQGLDYDHGTGHGVGSYLSVHEGPQRISKQPNTQALLPGMVLSDEPGYYKTGAYGIRIENLLAVRPDDSGGGQPSLAFEVLTLAPIDLALVDRSMLKDDEADWLNRYHHRVRDSLTPLLDSAAAGWLAEATRAI